MTSYLVILKVASLNSNTMEEVKNFHCEMYEAPHILDLLKEISRDNAGLKYDIIQITLIS